MIKKIKNNDSVAHTWCGQEIQPGDYYQIQAFEEVRWAEDSTLLTAVATGIAVVNDGTDDITDVNEAINFLKNEVPPTISISGAGLTTAEPALKTCPVKLEGSSTLLVSHDFCDRTTWWSESATATTETLTTSDDLTFQSAHEYWIDLEHSKVMYEDRIASTYKPHVFVDTVEVTTGFTVDYAAGTVTFAEAQTSKTVTATYHYENGSNWIIKPATGKILKVLGTEVKFAKDVVFSGGQQVVYQIYAYGYPAGPTVVYKSVRDFVVSAMGSVITIPAFGGLTNDVMVLPFSYVTSKEARASQNIEIKIGLKNCEALTGEWACMTAACVVLDE